jgi:hypothetical protein
MSDHDNYCSIDGSSLKEAVTSFSVLVKRPVFCPHCGIKVSGHSNYCLSCGSDLQTIDIQSNSSETLITSDKTKKTGPTLQSSGYTSKSFSYFKDYLLSPTKLLTVVKAISLGLGISFLINFVFAFFASQYLNSNLNTGLQDSLGEFSVFLPGELRFINISSVLLFMHGIMLKLTASASGIVSMKLNAQMGAYILLFLLALSFFVGGFINGKRLKNSVGQEVILYSVIVGLFNVIFLLLMVPFAQFNETMQIEFITGKLELRFAIIDILIKGFFLAFMMHSFGMLFSQKQKSRSLSEVFSLNFKYGTQVYFAAKTFVLGMIGTFVIMIIASWLTWSSFNPGALLYITQLIAYFYAMIHFSNFTFVQMDFGEVYKTNMNIFNYAKFDYYEDIWSGPLYGLAPWILYVGFAVIVILFLWGGYSMSKKHALTSITDIAIFGVFYAALTGFWIWIGNILFSISGSAFQETITTSMRFEANIFLYVIYAFIFSTFVAYIGTKLSKPSSTK